MNDERFDQLLDALHNEPVDAALSEQARARVGVQLQAAGQVPAVCGRFRLDFAAYKAGTLLESRRLLVQDHLGRCVDCRRVFEGAAAGRLVAMPAKRQSQSFTSQPWAKWAIAAGLAAVSVYAGRDYLDSAFAPSGARATVEAVRGELRGPNGPLAVGAKLQEGELVRTGAGARAVLRLADGSAVEMNQQAVLAVHAAWSGQTLDLAGGDVILQAAKQRRGRLRVRTRDSVASVKGTIFAVSTGLAGSLVAVAEGAVQVEQGAQQKLLKPGERAASSEALSGVPVREAFAWSQDSQRYLALLADFAKIEQAVMTGAGTTRTQARLLPSLPAHPMAYAAVPNIGSSLTRAVEDQLRQSATLRTWWESAQGKEFQRLLDAMNTIAPHLGEEVVFVLSGPNQRKLPLLMAEVKAGQRATLEQALAKLPAGEMAYRVTDKLLAVSESAADLNAVYATLGQGAATPFAAEIARRYQRGAGWMLAVNVEGTGSKPAEAAVLGVDGMRHVIFEQRSENGNDQNDATLTFNGARRGVASWLAAPAASGAAEYIGAEAVVAVAGLTKNPRVALDELLTALGRLHPEALTDLREFEQATGVRVADDLAGSLGADFAFSIETPTLPMPGWMLAAEVTRASTLEASVRRFVDAANARISDPKKRVVLGQETASGRQWTTLRLPESPAPVTLYWTYDRGYLIMSMDRAVAARAIATRNGGFPLVRSAGFRQRLPVSASMHQSGFVWMNTTEALRQLVAAAAPAWKDLLNNRGLLVVLNGETDRITAQSKTRLTSVVLDLAAAAMSSPLVPGEGQGKTVQKKLRNSVQGQDQRADEEQ